MIKKFKFLLFSLSVYLILFFFNPELVKEAFRQSIILFVKIIPFLFLIFFLMVLSNLFFDAKKIAKYVGEDSKVKGLMITILAGFISSGPIYMWYPLLRDLKSKGMKDSLIAVFLYNRAVKIPLLPLLVYYFGFAFTIVVSFYIIVFSVINGYIMGKFFRIKL